MKSSERHHLKENDLARVLGQANTWAGRHQRRLLVTVVTIILLAIVAVSFVVWRNNRDARARTLLAEAMVIQEAPVTPPAPPVDSAASDSASDPAAPGTPPAPPGPRPGSYPTERAKLEAALPKYIAAADAYPSTDPGQTARYYAAGILVGLGRFDEAIQQYDRVISDATGLLPQMSRLGKAEAQLRAAQYDAAIASFKELSERTDSNLPTEAMLLELARAYTLAGKNEDARKTLTQIVEQHADSPFATEAKQELEKIKG